MAYDGQTPRNEPDGSVTLAQEQALLGIMLYQNQALTGLGGMIDARHFWEPVHQRLFAAIKGEIDAGRLADGMLIAERMGEDPAFAAIGGAAYLFDLVDHAPPVSTARDYARSVFEAALRRDVVKVCDEAALTVRKETTTPVFDLISAVRRQLEQVEQDAAPEDASMISAPDAAQGAIVNMRERASHGRPRGCMTGLRCIDRRLNGLKPGALIVLGGRPAMGKTGLARAIAHGAATRNPEKEFLFLGIEMGPEEMMQREISSLTYEAGEGVEYRAMDSGALTPLDFMNIDSAHARVPRNLLLVDCPALSVDDVDRRIWALSRRGRVGAVFIDYLQIMRRPAAQGRNEATVLGEITGRLKQTARRAGVAIVLLSQLSRAVESRDDKRPMLSDLRESGSIEQDADAVLFPYRPHYYLQKSPPKGPQNSAAYLDWEVACQDSRRRMEVICAKQRGGAEGTDVQRYFAEFDHVEDDRDAA